AEMGDAGIVDQTIDAAEMIGDLSECSFQRDMIGYVDGEGKRLPAEARCCLVQCLLASSQDGQPDIPTGEGVSDREADVPRPSGNDDDLAVLAHAGTPITLVSRNSSNPSAPISRPLPLCL